MGFYLIVRILRLLFTYEIDSLNEYYFESVTMYAYLSGLVNYILGVN